MNLDFIKEKLKSLFYKTPKGKHVSKNAASYLNTIINNVPHFLVWKNTNSVFLGCNKKFADTLGLKSPEDIIGKTDYDFPWTEEQRAAYVADEKEIIRTGKPKLDYEETQTQKDGSTRVMLVSKVPMYDERNRISGVLIIYSDITERKHLEENLKKAKEESERANKAKSEFIRNISHDVRTPLAGIQQATRLIAEGKTPEADSAEYAYAAWEASKKLMGLFNQIIDVSKKEYFDFEDRIVKFDLYKLLQGLRETYEVVAKHKKLKLEIECAEDVPNYLLGKHLRLHRVLMNLLGNALKFTEKGSVRLLVEKAQESDDKILLRFSVIDTGIGISEEKHDAIFEPFSRLNPSFEGQYPGSGLGLHVVKDYVQKMQGEIYVESEEGHGSIFTSILPFKRSILENDNDVVETDYAEEIAPVALEKKTKESKKGSVSYEVGKLKILLVEDDSLARKMGTVMLNSMGFKVDVAKSGEEAIELSFITPYDIIYMDVGLPRMSGIEATRQIRGDVNNKSKKSYIVALTAHADEAIAKECLAAGMQQVLSKPLSPEKSDQILSLLNQPINTQEKKVVVDFNLWNTRLGESKSMLEELFHTLAQDFDENRETIIEAYENQDLPLLQNVTHKLKGSLAYCGLPRLEAVIKSIESAAKQNNMEEVSKYYQETIDALDEAKEFYNEWAITHPKQV